MPKPRDPAFSISANLRRASAKTPSIPGPLRRVFLETLARTGNVSAAARAAGLPRRTIYDVRARDPEFAADWRMAAEEALDDLEEALRDRAISGIPKAAAKEGAGARNFSDTAGLYILKSRRGNPEADSLAGDGEGAAGESPRETLLRRLAEMNGAEMNGPEMNGETADE